MHGTVNVYDEKGNSLLHENDKKRFYEEGQVNILNIMVFALIITHSLRCFLIDVLLRGLLESSPVDSVILSSATA